MFQALPVRESVPLVFPIPTLYEPLPKVAVPEPVRLKLPDSCEYPVIVDNAPELIRRPFMVLVVVFAVITPVSDTEKLEPEITVLPVERPRVRSPVPLAVIVSAELGVVVEIREEPPPKRSVLELKVFPLIRPSTVRFPFVWIFPLEESDVPVDP